jgi:hypothetical protein
LSTSFFGQSGRFENCLAVPFGQEPDLPVFSITEDIEECLTVVVKALKKCGLPPAEVVAWCDRMLKTDRVGFIYREELQALRTHAHASQS